MHASASASDPLWVFSFGEAAYHGSAPEAGFPGAPAVRLVPTSYDRGYWVVLEDGSVLGFGSAGQLGHGPHVQTVGMAAA